MAREVEMCVEAFYGSEGTCLFKPLPLVVGWEGGTIGEEMRFYIGIYRKKSFKFFSKIEWPEKLKLVWKHPRIVLIKVVQIFIPRVGLGYDWGLYFYIGIYKEKSSKKPNG